MDEQIVVLTLTLDRSGHPRYGWAYVVTGKHAEKRIWSEDFGPFDTLMDALVSFRRAFARRGQSPSD